MSRPAQSRSEAHATKSPDLTSAEPTLKYRQPSGDVDLTRSGRSSDRIYEANPAVPSSREEKQHGRVQAPRVRIVSRDEYSEFVECLECGEVFESSEFKDMTIEDTKLKDEL